MSEERTAYQEAYTILLVACDKALDLLPLNSTEPAKKLRFLLQSAVEDAEECFLRDP
ncbi:MAG: hypothetical protein HFG44_07035 [Oscillospiraceae bacterium]|jgi:hypothetical protein|nr:hypothetical protein [Oscillospiraceae bacterium]